jgi:hypothetical protein
MGEVKPVSRVRNLSKIVGPFFAPHLYAGRPDFLTMPRLRQAAFSLVVRK